MRDQKHKRYKKLYKEEFEIASQALAPHEGAVEWSQHDYEAFTYKTDGVSLVFYPHRTSANNYHIRVRDNGSKDKTKASHLMRVLDAAAGNNCTFARKLHP